MFLIIIVKLWGIQWIQFALGFSACLEFRKNWGGILVSFKISLT